MPQVKGQATWLTNVRQKAVDRRAGIDSSMVKIENGRIEEDMRRTLDHIHLARHRALTEREFDLKETKSTAKNYASIQYLAKENSVEAVVSKRRATGMAHSAGPTRTAPRPTSEYGGKRPQTGMANTGKSSFGPVYIDDDTDEDEGDGEDTDFHGDFHTRGETPKARSKTAKSSMPPRCPRQKFVGRSLREIRKSLYEEFTTNHEGEENGEGRSFQELKDASHIDKLHDAQRAARETKCQRLKERMIEDEKFRLQQKLKGFYRDLEVFKGSPNKHNPRTGYTYVYS